MMTQGSLPEICFGSNQPLPKKRVLRAGPVTVILENGNLRYVKLGENEIVRGIYAAIRDENWGTILPAFEKYEVTQSENSFVVNFIAQHQTEKIDFTWHGKIVGRETGEILYEMDGMVNKDFLRNRIGFCILHPMEFAGISVRVLTPEGEINGAFPKYISPHQPFKEMTSIRHFVSSGIEMELNFFGDLFEMEDQRNWTDASFKTYCTPLRIPYPVLVKKGDRVNQTVQLCFRGVTSGIVPMKDEPQALKISIGKKDGKLPAIGMGNDSSYMLMAKEQELLSKLKLAHLHDVINLNDYNWKNVLLRVSKQAVALSCPLELEILAEDKENLLKAFMEELIKLEANVARISIFPSYQFTTTDYLVETLKTMLESFDLNILVGGGSRAYFTELNRAELPIGLLDFVSYTINPQVHAFDHASLIETLGGQAETVKSTQKIVKGLPIMVSPITFKPRFNPNATSKVEERKEDKLDCRQRALFGACWTIGSIHNLAKEGVSSLTYYETTGCLGIVDEIENTVYPIYHVFADIAPFNGGNIHSIELTNPFKTEAIAVSLEGKLRLLVANLTNEELSINIDTPLFKSAAVRSFDENSFHEALDNPIHFIKKQDYLIEESGNQLKVNILPVGILRIDLELESIN